MSGLARAANTAMNLQLIAIGGMVVGFIAGALVGAYLLAPLGGWGAVGAIAAPLLGIYVGGRTAISLVASR